MNEQEARIEAQKELIRAFKDGIKTTFYEEISSRITYRHLFDQPNSIILQYTAWKILSMILLWLSISYLNHLGLSLVPNYSKTHWSAETHHFT